MPDIYAALDALGIGYARYDHAPVFTCDEAAAAVPNVDAVQTKNLFLRDKRGRRHFLLVTSCAKAVDIKRFADPKKLVKYMGLNPAFDDSGEGKWSGGIGGHGRKDLRCLLIEGAQAILRSSRTPLAQWGRKLLARRGQINLVVAAMARKLTVSVWYLMSGRWTALEEMEPRLVIKVGKMISQMGVAGLEQLGKTRKAFREEIFQSLKAGKTYRLEPDKKFTPKVTVEPPLTRAQEYGLR